MTIKKEQLYKLPYTKNNNPNGWIEPTTFCQLRCPHCYRQVHKGKSEQSHRKLNDVLSEIDELIKIRNISHLSIAGGEPLLYPGLDEVIEYAVSKNLCVTLQTNGILIDKDRLISLDRLGVSRIIIHIDKFQNRESTNTEEGVNKIRKQYCNLFREVGGKVTLGFIMPLSDDNFKDLDILIPFFKENVDIIKGITFTTLSVIPPGEKLPIKKLSSVEGIFDRVKKLYGLEYSSYLGKTKSDKIAWLFAYNVFSGGELLGSVDKDVIKMVQRDNYQRTGKYLFITNKNYLSWRSVLLIFNKSIWRMIIKYIFLKNKSKISGQLLNFTNSPDNISDGWSLCDGCPNAILFQGKLVPSCLLELVKIGEDIKVE